MPIKSSRLRCRGDSAYGNRFAFRAHLRVLKLPFNDRLGPSENVDRGLPCPRLLPQYFEPVPGYGLGSTQYVDLKLKMLLEFYKRVLTTVAGSG